MTCLHRQAEEVALNTGEIVACVCVECLEQLPPSWITWQHDRAHRIATCRHGSIVELPELGNPVTERMCLECGASPPSSGGAP